jgi:hypothetical protein
MVLQNFRKMDLGDLTAYKVLPIQKSSPLGSLSYSRLIDSYIALKNKPVFKDILEYINVTSSKNFNILFKNIEFLMAKLQIDDPLRKKFFIKHLTDDFETVTLKVKVPPSKKDLPIGKLSFKEEAAGKLRVFAMVDIITQSLLGPLHESLFSLFKELPNDFTHNQDKGFAYVQSLSLKHGRSFGYDLSAATDRLPLSSQISVLDSLYGIGKIWGNILINRDYVISKNDYGIEPQSIRYAVGQPMGALSS